MHAEVTEGQESSTSKNTRISRKLRLAFNVMMTTIKEKHHQDPFFLFIEHLGPLLKPYHHKNHNKIKYARLQVIKSNLLHGYIQQKPLFIRE